MRKLTEREIILLHLMVFVVLVIGSWRFLISPAISKYNNTRNRLSMLVDQYNFATRQIDSEDQIDNELRNAVEKLNSGFQLPHTMPSEEIDKLITELFVICDIIPDSLSLESPHKADQFEVINKQNLTVEATCSEENFRRLIALINGKKGIIIKNFTYKSDNQSVSVGLSVFTLNEKMGK